MSCIIYYLKLVSTFLAISGARYIFVEAGNWIFDFVFHDAVPPIVGNCIMEAFSMFLYGAVQWFDFKFKAISQKSLFLN